MEQEKGLIEMVDKLVILFEELKKEQLNLLEQYGIGKNLADCTDNVENLRLIVNTMYCSIEHIVKEDSKTFDQTCELLKKLKKVFDTFERMESCLKKKVE